MKTKQLISGNFVASIELDGMWLVEKLLSELVYLDYHKNSNINRVEFRSWRDKRVVPHEAKRAFIEYKNGNSVSLFAPNPNDTVRTAGCREIQFEGTKEFASSVEAKDFSNSNTPIIPFA